MSNYLFISDAAKEVKVESHVLRYWEEELHLPIKRNELGHRYYTREDVERFKTIKGMKERGLQLKAIKMILKDGKLDLLSGQPEEMKEEVVRQAETEQETVLQAGEEAEAIRQAGEEEEVVRQTEAEQGTVRTEEEQETVLPKSREKAQMPLQAGERTSEENRISAQSVKGQAMDEPLQAGQSANIVKAGGAALAAESKEEKSKRLQWLLQQLIRETLQENNEELCREIKESVVKELDYQFRMKEERDERRDKMIQEREEEHYKRMDELLRKKARKGFRAGKKKKDISI